MARPVVYLFVHPAGLSLCLGRFAGYAGGMSDLCEWPVDMSCFPDVPEGKETVARVAIDTATEILWALTGRQFGICPVAHDVMVEECLTCEPTLWRGEWFNVDVSARQCMQIHLAGPVYQVDKVLTSTGEELDYRHVGDTVVVRAGRPSTIVYQRGIPVPKAAAYMVGRLAAERFLQCVDPKRCSLPRYATSVQRQGVSVQMASPADVIDRGVTGLVDVDTWIKAVNPNAMAEDSEVLG